MSQDSLREHHNETQSANAATQAQTADDASIYLVPDRPKGESTISVIAAIVGNILVGIVKFIAAAISGSAAMVSEGIHSIVDSGNGILVLYGIHASKKKPDLEHPFGYGKTLYFFAFIVAVLIFALGGGVSIYKGITAYRSASAAELGDPTLNYIIIAIAMIIEGACLIIALRQIHKEKGEQSLWQFIRKGKDPSHFTVVLEDSAAEAGLIVALIGVFGAHQLGIPELDAIASIVIGLLLVVVAVVLLRETKGLLIGEGLDGDEIEEIVRLVETDEIVRKCGRVLSMYMGPDDILLTLDIAFDPEARETDVMRSIDRIEAAVASRFPQANRIFIEAESLRNVLAQAKRQEEAIQEEREEEAS